MSDEIDLHLTVEAEDAAASSRQAQLLERLILEEFSTQVRRIRADQNKMDGGATLALALASPVLVELVKTIKAFLLQRRASKIVVKKDQSSFTIDGASDQQINALLAFLRHEQ